MAEFSYIQDDEAAFHSCCDSLPRHN